jgi:prepilin signal peptidase PulO-like enzyme (type II secretory pathway)
MGPVRSGEAVVVDARALRHTGSVERSSMLQHPVPVVAVSAVFGGLAFVTYPLGAGAMRAAVMAVVLVILSATDLERRIIPNRIVLPATAILLFANVAISPGHALEFILVALGAGLAFLIPNLINASLMGMGDVKLIMLLGAGLGWGAVGAIMVAFLAVFPFALGTLIRRGAAARKTALPFGPFLALGGLVILFVPHLVGVG